MAITTVVYMRNKLFAVGYQRLLKPFFFQMDPEVVHDRMIAFGSWLGRTSIGRWLVRMLFDYQHPDLQQTILGINFPNPIGLAAGFDKNAQLTQILPAVGFGFAEVGSITGESCAGNPGKRLWRLPKSKSLVVYYGLKNDGCQVISQRLQNVSFKIPVGISIAKTNNQATCETDAGIADYAKAFEYMKDIGDYITINISCPNAYGGQPFTDYERLEALLSRLDMIEYTKPIFIKLSPDLSHEQVNMIIKLANMHRVQGFICTNLTKNRANPKVQQNIVETVLPEQGGLSGKVVADLSTELIRYVYKQTQGKYVIIGCGGVFSARDAYEKITAGASLIQLITGMIYQGPQLISEINLGLVELLQRDGYQNIAEAVGAASRTD